MDKATLNMWKAGCMLQQTTATFVHIGHAYTIECLQPQNLNYQAQIMCQIQAAQLFMRACWH